LPHDAYLTHFWSLSIEEQFYFVWPFMLYFLTSGVKRLRFWFFTIALVIIFRIIIFTHHQEIHGWRFYYDNTFCRIDSLIVGAILCQLQVNKIMVSDKWIHGVFIFFSSTVIISILWLGNCKLSNPFMGTVGYTVIAICFACLIRMATNKERFLSKVLMLPFLRFSGKISYGLYIFHWPILLLLGTRLTNFGIANINLSSELIGLLSAIIVVPVSFGVSYLSFRYYESYFMRFKR
jgi:peptidoglycan/LPS O-acetylase OafA/YrhL